MSDDPSVWYHFFSNEHQREYYHNPTSQTTQWTVPSYLTGVVEDEEDEPNEGSTSQATPTRRSWEGLDDEEEEEEIPGVLQFVKLSRNLGSSSRLYVLVFCASLLLWTAAIFFGVGFGEPYCSADSTAPDFIKSKSMYCVSRRVEDIVTAGESIVERVESNMQELLLTVKDEPEQEKTAEEVAAAVAVEVFRTPKEQEEDEKNRRCKFLFANLWNPHCRSLAMFAD